MSELVAKTVLIPYLWFGGYAMDEESIAECNDCIEIQCREAECKKDFLDFFFVSVSVN